MHLTICALVGGGALFPRILLREITGFFPLASLYCHEMLCFHDRAVREKIYTCSTLYAYYKSRVPSTTGPWGLSLSSNFRTILGCLLTYRK